MEALRLDGLVVAAVTPMTESGEVNFDLIPAIVEHYAEERSKGLYATSRVSDDGMIDPRDTRTVISMVLSVCHNETVEGAKGYGTWRM